ncbi:MAG: HAD-IIIC family phosphatase [Nocardioides sp.]
MTEVKCVVWDLDGTVWPDVAIEQPEGQELVADPDVVAAMARLARSGVVNAVASRSDPGIAPRLDAIPEVSDLLVGRVIAWHDKSRSLELLADQLGIAVDAMVLVDDSAFERAEVAAHTAARTIEPRDFLVRLDEFLPEQVSAEASRRTERYRTDAARRSAAEQHADHRSFLESAHLRLRVSPATPDDEARVSELLRRAHRLSSTALVLEDDALAAWRAPDRAVVVARLTDDFGDYGLIGAALLTLGKTVTVDLLAVSCRVAGRGAAAAFLATLIERARPSGLELPVVATTANVELRVLLRTLGLQAEETGPGTLRAYAPPELVPPDVAPWIAVEST